jgi:hypothetical protein
MDRKEQIQLAFEICERLYQLETALWDCYFNEFMELINQKNDTKSEIEDHHLTYPF